MSEHEHDWEPSGPTMDSLPPRTPFVCRGCGARGSDGLDPDDDDKIVVLPGGVADEH